MHSVRTNQVYHPDWPAAQARLVARIVECGGVDDETMQDMEYSAVLPGPEAQAAYAFDDLAQGVEVDELPADALQKLLNLLGEHWADMVCVD